MELKKGQTIMMNVDLDMPAAILHEAVSNRSGMPLEGFALYYRSKKLEGEAALSSWQVGKDAIIEVKTRGRGGVKEAGSSGDVRYDLLQHGATASNLKSAAAPCPAQRRTSSSPPARVAPRRAARRTAPLRTPRRTPEGHYRTRHANQRRLFPIQAAPALS